MIKDFSKFQTIIDKFRGEVSEKDFDARFSASTKTLAKTEKFLLKMELKRLASSCTRLIDLRGLVDGECKTFEHDGRVHFIDELAIKVFEENIAYYGSYTFGVYEAVKNTKNNFRVIYHNEQSKIQVAPIKTEESKVFEKMQYPATFYQFGSYQNRKEERMNFAIGLIITLENNEIVDAISSDISISGCKFRLKNESRLIIGQPLRMRFVGLENEFQFGTDSNFDYQICNVDHDGVNQLVGVKRLSKQLSDSFSQFLKGYIQGNKRRYKINLDNTISALQARALEQFVLPKSNELPVFIEKTNKGLLPRYALTSNNSQATFQYWQDEKHNSTLHCLLKKERLAYLTSSGFSAKTLLVFSFIHHSKGQSFFYTADEQELKHNLEGAKEFTQRFLGFAASKPSFAVTELSYIDVDVNKSQSPFTVADSLSKRNQYLNLPLSEDVLSILADLPGIVIIRDITQQQAINEYQSLTYDNIDKELLKTFGHRRLSQPVVVDELGINYKNHRQEPRFKYKTPATIDCEGVKCSGVSHDFSISGLKIELKSAETLKKGDVVNLTFPDLQKITSVFNLKQLPYEIMQINKKKTIINLRVYVKQHQHIGRSFFKLLIEKNRDKLTSDEYVTMIPGLNNALRTLYANSLTSLSLVIQKSGSRYKIESITASTQENELLAHMQQLSDRSHYLNLYPLLNNLQATSLLQTNLKKMHSSDEPLTHVLYIAINPDMERVDQAVTTKLASELGSAQLKKEFINNALKRGVFYCIQTKLSRTNEPDMDHLNPELSYISSYAIHRGKQIEQDIWSVVGMVQLFDITKETLFRHQLQSVN